MGSIRKKTQGSSLRALTATLVLALLAAVLLAGTALAAGHEGLSKSAKPGRPTAKSPKGTIATATPTFKWSKVKGATRYEVRLYEGGQLGITVTDLRRPSWTLTNGELHKNVDLSWKVRASNARGNGPWSKTLHFMVVTS